MSGTRWSRRRLSAIGKLRGAPAQPSAATDDEVIDALATRSYKRIPPGSGHVLTPVSSRSAACAAIAMYSASRSRALLAQRVALHAVRLAGPRVLPGRAMRSPFPADWPAVAKQLFADLGSFDDAVVYERPQPDRSGFALLLLSNGAATAFVKLQPSRHSQLGRESAALHAMRQLDLRDFTVPAVLASATAGTWTYLALEPFPPALHRPPAAPPLEAITAEIRDGLGGLPRDAATPQDWTPMHGDFTPWNLREFSDGRLLLIDWENAGWGPPGADLVLYRASAAALGASGAGVEDYPQAVVFWRDQLSAASPTERDERLRTALLRELGGSDSSW